MLQNKRLRSFVFYILVIIFFIMLASLTGCGKDYGSAINVNDYVKVEPDGYDGYGSVSFSINYNALFEDHLPEGTGASDLIDFVKKFEPFVAKFEKRDDLKNGDVVDLDWKKNKDVINVLEETLQKNLIIEDTKYTVEGLYKTIEYDPFDELCIETNGTEDGQGTINFYIKHQIKGRDPFIWPVEHNGNDGELKNGDVLHLTLSDEYNATEFTKITGLEIIKTEIDYTVDCLCVPAIDATIFEKIADSTKENFELVIKDWVVNGLNDLHASSIKSRTYKNVGYVYYTNPLTDKNENVSDVDSGMFFAIYEIVDYGVYTPYYVFIGIDGRFTIDHQRVYLNGQEFSDSFVDYKKEKVRYSSSVGWVNDCEEMGFLIDDMLSYAGHQECQETLNFIRKIYGKNYDNEFISEDLKQILLNVDNR